VKCFLFVFVAVLASFGSLAQSLPKNNGAVQGTVKDQTGGVIPGAAVTITDQGGRTTTITTGADGAYAVRNLPVGVYSVLVSYSGLRQKGSVLLTVEAGHTAIGNVAMTVREQKQEINITDAAANQVSTDPASNSSSLVLRQEDLAALPDDPDDLQADLEALAGPAAIRFLLTALREAAFRRSRPFARFVLTPTRFQLSSTSSVLGALKF